MRASATGSGISLASSAADGAPVADCPPWPSARTSSPKYTIHANRIATTTPRRGAPDGTAADSAGTAQRNRRISNRRSRRLRATFAWCCQLLRFHRRPANIRRPRMLIGSIKTTNFLKLPASCTIGTIGLDEGANPPVNALGEHAPEFISAKKDLARNFRR